MKGSFAGRLSALAAGAALLASVAVAPMAVDAAGMMTGVPATAQGAAAQPARPDLQVVANGVDVDAKGNTAYTFTVKNVGTGAARDVRVTQLSQVKETATPQKVRKTISVVEYDEIPAGQERVVTVLCEQSPRYTCEYASVTVSTDSTDAQAGDTFAAQGV